MTVAIRAFGLVVTMVVSCTTDLCADAPASPESASHQQLLRELRTSQYQVVTETNTPATKTVDDLRGGVETSLNKVQSVAVDYRVTSIRLTESESERQMKAQGKLGSALWNAAYRYAMKDDKRLSASTELAQHRFLDSAKGVATYDIRMLWDGHQTTKYDSANSSGSITSKKNDSILDQGKRAYFQFIGFGHQSQVKDHFLTSPKGYRVLPHLERVDDFPCHVISSGWDTIWIDHQHGYAVRRRVLLSGPSLSTATIAQLRYCKDFSQVDQEVWWPKECCSISYLAAFDPSANSSDIHDIRHVVVDKLEINNVSDETFVVAFPPGTLVADLTINTAYYMPERANRLQDAIKLGVPIKDGVVSGEPGIVAPKP